MTNGGERLSAIDEFVEELDEIEHGESTRAVGGSVNDRLERWQSHFSAWLRDNVGQTHVLQFLNKRTGGWGNPHSDRYHAWREYALSLKLDIQKHPERYPKPKKLNSRPVAVTPKPTDDVAQIETILARFHSAALQLRKRYDDRETLDVSDEYDVQDLLHVLLRSRFDDVRPEEVSPSYAGSGSRIDFLLKKARVAIEVKMPNAKLRDAKLGEQLVVDIARYQQHQDCGTLICFIYDPAHHLKNPAGLVTDLSKRHGTLEVRVIIVP